MDLEEHLGQVVDGDLPFIDDQGQTVRIGDYFGLGHPIVMILAYYNCPMLCGVVLRSATRGLGALALQLGKDYQALTVSIDPHDSSAAAVVKRGATLAGGGFARVAESSATPSDRAARPWPFLTGAQASIDRLTDQVGFRYAYDKTSAQYAHPAALIVLTSEGRIARYLYGAEFSPQDLRFALVEAGSGRIGTIVDRVLLTCYRFDPATRRYGPFMAGFLRIGAIFIFAAVATLIVLMMRIDRKRALAPRAAPTWERNRP